MTRSSSRGGSASGVGGGLGATTTLSGTAPKESVVSRSKLDAVVWSLIGPR